MDQIHIKNLEVYAHHGVFPEENALGQRFVISASLFTDTWAAGQTDELSHSIHYGEVSQRMKRYMETHTHKLLERHRPAAPSSERFPSHHRARSEPSPSGSLSRRTAQRRRKRRHSRIHPGKAL